MWWEVDSIMVIIWTIYLGILAIIDGRTHRVPYIMLRIGIVLYLVSLSLGCVPVVMQCIGIGVGVLFIFISKATQEAIGYGDSYVFTILGGGIGGYNLIMAMMVGFLLGGTYGCMKLARKKECIQVKIAFLPFFFIGYLITMQWGV